MIDKIKVDKLIAYIANCDAFEVIGESPWLSGVTWDGLATGDPDNQVVFISWHNAVGNQHSVILTEQGLSDAKIEDNTILCQDHEGEDIEIGLWKTEPLEIIL